MLVYLPLILPWACCSLSAQVLARRHDFHVNGSLIQIQCLENSSKSGLFAYNTTGQISPYSYNEYNIRISLTNAQNFCLQIEFNEECLPIVYENCVMRRC